MRQVGRLLYILFQLVCIAALVYVVSGFAALIFASMPDVCPVYNEGSIRCTSPTYTAIGEYGMRVMLLTVFTGFPALLAIAGLFFLVRAVLRWRRGSAPPARLAQQPAPSSSAGRPWRSLRLPANPWLRYALYGIGAFLAAGFVTGVIKNIVG